MSTHDFWQEEQDLNLCVSVLRKILEDDREAIKPAEKFKAVELMFKRYQHIMDMEFEPLNKPLNLPLMPTFAKPTES